ncbi:MAG TPA: hypothetical protein VG711_04880 [Phycisphaerales bacterium]|nr:hypothetical protein [Phycisphaerales bacterium]
MSVQEVEQQTGAALLTKFAHAVIIEPLHCRQCGYNLRTLRADGYCPECGLEIWQTILHTIDPAASRMPSIRNPRAVGNALVGMMAAIAIQMLLLGAPALVQRFMVWEMPMMDSLLEHLPRGSWWATGALVLGVAACTWMLAPPVGKEPPGPVWRDVMLLGTGEAVWIASMGLMTHGIEWWDTDQPGSRLVLTWTSAASAGVALLGLRGVLQIIGQRSSEYRRSRAGRQGAGTMMAAIGFATLGASMRELSRLHFIDAYWSSVGSLILWAAMLMLSIGLGYMLVNVWWIRNAMRKPPMTLDQILLPPLDDDTSIPDTTTSGGV